MVVFSTFSVFSVSPPRNVVEAGCELRASGISQAGLERLLEFHDRFIKDYAKVENDKDKSETFCAECRQELDKFIESMIEEDQVVFKNYLKKYGAG